MPRAVVGQGCACVKDHSPSNYVVNRHHIVPQSWGGKTEPANLVPICANTHTSVHALLDEYVRAGGDPGWSVRQQFTVYVRRLALRAWEQRPDHPTITSLHS